jgi:hypothetical protein
MLALQRNSRFSLMRQRIEQQGRGSKRFRDTGLEEFDFMDFLSQRRKENNASEIIDVDSFKETKKKVQKLKRDNSGYDPRNARESSWFKYYVSEQSDLYMDPTTRRGEKFRRRFRMPKISTNTCE